eukprot:gene7150-11463_t
MSNSGDSSSWFWIFFVIYMVSISIFVKYKLEPKIYNSEHSKFNLNKTIERAKFLSDTIGNRILGSTQEKQTNEWILKELHKIKPKLQKLGKVKIETQLVSGDYHWDLPYIENSPFVYTNITNILIHIEPKNQKYKDEIFLVASHFDSALTSPGFYDDGLPTSIMLDYLENLPDSNVTLKHPLIFLFATAEEYGLLGSKGFVDHHPLAKKCKAFINLEACGGKGRNLLFQAENAWIMKQYSKSVLNFKGNSILQDIFQSGFIPADTDYKSFSGIGSIGIDTAFYENGQIYHTSVDDSDSLDVNSVQHMGQSTELFVNHMIGLDENYQDKNTKNSQDAISSAFYFDFLSYKLFVYNFEEIKLVFYSILGIGMIIFLQNLYKMGLRTYFKVSFLHLVSLGSGLLFVNIFAFIVTFLFKNSMVWYTNGSKFGTLMYLFPSIFGVCLPFYLFHNSNENVEDIYISNLAFWLKMLLIGIYFQKGFSMICLLFIASLSSLIILKKLNIFWFYLIFFIPSIYLLEFEYTTMEFGYAIIGRAFTKFGEFVFGSIVSFYITGFAIFIIPFLLKNKKITKNFMMYNFIMSLIFLISTLFLFPYAEKTPKRIIIEHLIEYGDINKTKEIIQPKDSYFAMISTDSVDLSIISEMKKPDRIEKRNLFFIPTLGPPDLDLHKASIYSTMKDDSILQYSKVYSKGEIVHSIIPLIDYEIKGNEKLIKIESNKHNIIKVINFNTKCQIVKWSLDENIYEKFNGTNYIYTIRQANGFHNFENGKTFNLKIEQKSNCSEEEKLIHFEVNSMFLSSNFDIKSTKIFDSPR